MNRRRLLALAGTSVCGLAAAYGTRGTWVPFGGRLRVGLAPVVPGAYRSADRETVAGQLDDRLPPLVGPTVERAPSEWHLLVGLADGEYDVVELGAVTGAVALDAGLAGPLVQPTLAGGREYEGSLLAATEDAPDSRPEGQRVAVGGPLATPAHAALARDADGDVRALPSQVRWHERSPSDALGEDSVAFVASDEFHAPPDATVHRSYPIPVPALYARVGVGNVDRLRRRFAGIEGGQNWFRDADKLTGDDGREWLGDAPDWLADLRLPSGPEA